MVLLSIVLEISCEPILAYDCNKFTIFFCMIYYYC